MALMELYDKNIFINSSCLHCRDRFINSRRIIASCNLCDALWHNDCIQNYDFSNKSCKCTIEYVAKSFNNDNINSMTMTSYKPNWLDVLRGIFRIIVLLTMTTIMYIIHQLGYTTEQNIRGYINSIINLLNITIRINGLDNIDPNIKKSFVCNHVSFHDTLIFNQFPKTGFLASIILKRRFLGKLITSIIPILFIKRGKQKNTVELIDKFIDEHSSILIFPQGMMTNYKYLTKFRTGAFSTKYPVQPIYLKYDKDVSSITMFGMLCLDSLSVEINVMELVEKNIDESPIKYANRVRELMATKGNFQLSDVESYDVID